jgi:hypothetical protein
LGRLENFFDSDGDPQMRIGKPKIFGVFASRGWFLRGFFATE